MIRGCKDSKVTIKDCKIEHLIIGEGFIDSTGTEIEIINSDVNISDCIKEFNRVEAFLYAENAKID